MEEGGTGAMHGEGMEKRGRSESDEWEEGGGKDTVREREHEGRRMDPSHSSSSDEGEAVWGERLFSVSDRGKGEMQS